MTLGPLGAAVDGGQGAFQGHIGQPVGVGAVQRVVRIRGLRRENRDAFGDVAVGGHAGDTVIAAEFGDVVLAWEPALGQYRLPERG
ncbi:hypothetical protein ACWEJ6_53815 [Nonomuraea sp. NPDC004702]